VLRHRRLVVKTCNFLRDELRPTAEYADSPKATFQRRHPDVFVFFVCGTQGAVKHFHQFRMEAGAEKGGGGARRRNVISRGFTASYVSWRVSPSSSYRLSPIHPQRRKRKLFCYLLLPTPHLSRIYPLHLYPELWTLDLWHRLQPSSAYLRVWQQRANITESQRLQGGFDIRVAAQIWTSTANLI